MALQSSLRRSVLAALAAAAAVAAGDVEACLANGRASAECSAINARDSVLLQVHQGPATKKEVSEHGKPDDSEHGKTGHHGSAAKCQFANPPETPYYWDLSCADGESEGCFADSQNVECRFCGEAPYTGVPCPPEAIAPTKYACDFDNAPVTEFYWDVTCEEGMVGCLADNKHIGCRFCGGDGAYANVTCPQCTFPNEPRTPYFVDESCEMGMLGCRADGIHDKCRFCGRRPWHSIECPADVHVPAGACYFPDEQDMPHYWEPECEMGKLGCWADGYHAECRYCGKGAYSGIPCP